MNYRYIFPIIIFWMLANQLVLADDGLVEKIQKLEKRIGELESANASNEKAKVFFVEGERIHSAICRKISARSRKSSKLRNVFCNLEKSITIKKQSLLIAFAQAKIKKRKAYPNIDPRFILYKSMDNTYTPVSGFGRRSFNVSKSTWTTSFKPFAIYDTAIIEPGVYELYVETRAPENDNTDLVNAYIIANEYMKVVILPVE